MVNFDILIIGGGHSGCEAAWLSSDFGLKIGLVSMEGVGLASAPCNPAVGGVGKGQVVREIDSLGGLMGQVADSAGIQYRVLNESKGYAVQSTRVQIDKFLYSELAEKALAERESLTIIRGEVLSIEKVNEIFKTTLSSGKHLISKKMIITTGTFLGAKTHCGSLVKKEGRSSSPSSVSIQKLLGPSFINTLRFKTGTPPRLKKNSLDFDEFIEQKSDKRALNFHWQNAGQKRKISQVSCYLTHTTPETMEIIRSNKENSPIFNGQVSAVGPRYCPSIEDKGDRYPERDVHHVFVEPEGLSSEVIYPNGLSTSLPADIQLKFIRSIKGFALAEIEENGYAVEYDVMDTLALSLTLEHKKISGLYFAGQINGTSGYEEAAGQGLVAGVNAAFSCLGRGPFIISRENSYIGVMIQDLVTIERDEPYRLFTARNENRLYVREDNTIERMHEYRKSFQLNATVDNYQADYMKELYLLTTLINDKKYFATDKNKQYFKEKEYGSIVTVTSLAELIRRPDLNPVETLFFELNNLGLSFKREVIQSVAVSEKYKGYIKRNEVDKKRVDRSNSKKVSWERLVGTSNISNECKQRIQKIQPLTFGQLRRIEGLRPATLAYIARDLL